jgi:predicted acetyltransferase
LLQHHSASVVARYQVKKANPGTPNRIAATTCATIMTLFELGDTRLAACPSNFNGFDHGHKRAEPGRGADSSMKSEKISLVEPTTELRESYDSLMREFVSRGDKLVPFVLEFPYDDFDGLVKKLQEFSEGRGLPEGFVPHSTYWLVKAGKQIVGVSNLRHRLTPRLEREGGHIGYGVRPSERQKGYGTLLLAKTLEMAKAKGLSRVLITCGKENVGSVQVILRNGGVFDSEQFIPEREEVVQRYWIELI